MKLRLWIAACLFGWCAAAHAQITISKNDGVTSAVPGGSVTYVIVVTNVGGVDEIDIVVSDNFPAACDSVDYTSTAKNGTGNTPAGSGDIADTLALPAGGSVTYFATCQIDPAATGSLDNTASFDSPNFEGSAQDVDELVPGTDLTITKSDGVGSVIVGSVVAYQIVVANTGTTDAPGAQVNDTFPPELTGCSWACTVVSGAATCPGPGSDDISTTVDLAAGSSVRFDTACTVGNGSTLINTASVQPPPGIAETDPSDNQATDTDQIFLETDLSITKTDGVTSVAPGDTTTYTVVATNLGPNPAIAVVSDGFPLACGVVSYTSAASGGATGNTAAGSGNLNDTLDLPVGGSVTYTADCTIALSASGTLDNTANIGFGNNPEPMIDPVAGNDSETDSDTIVVPPVGADVSGTKTVTGAPFDVGANVTYTVVLTNNGVDPQGDNAGDEFTDILPAQLALVSASATSGSAAPNLPTNTVTWNGSLAVSASVTITIQATILPGTEGDVVFNQGTLVYDSTGDGTNDANRPTDNPAVGGPADPTVFTVAGGTVPPPSEIPTLSDLGIGALSLLLAGLAMRRMRRSGAL